MTQALKAILGLAPLVLATSCAGYGPAESDRMATGQQLLAASAPAADRCAALSGMALENTRIVSAELIADGAVVPGAMTPDFPGFSKPTPISGLPDFCRIVAKSSPEPGSDINFEVWLPAQNWNDRLYMVGNGGFAGSISHIDMVQTLKSGHATASTDTGHQAGGQDGDWAKGNPARIRDYGWRAVHETTVNAKALLAAFYGKPQDKAYFASCSNGGRQALMEASRFPADYDGIVAGAPAAPFSKLAMSMLWSQEVQRPAGAAISTSQIRFIGEEAVRQCDGVDGMKDGLIDDPRKCAFDYAKFTCGSSTSKTCLSTAQANALRRMQDGPRNSAGAEIAGAYLLSGAESGIPVPFLGWENWIAAADTLPPLHQTANALYPESLLRNFVAQPFATPETFDWDKHPAMFAKALDKDLNPEPALKPFFDRGGKLIIWHGWSDGAIPALHAIDYHAEALRRGGPNAKDNLRLFVVPGLQHCFGGTGAISFGQTSAPQPTDKPAQHLGMAMRAWLEAGRSPESVVGTFSAGLPRMAPAGPARERLHCAYPKTARIASGANPDLAASYTCR